MSPFNLSAGSLGCPLTPISPGPWGFPFLHYHCMYICNGITSCPPTFTTTLSPRGKIQETVFRTRPGGAMMLHDLATLSTWPGVPLDLLVPSVQDFCQHHLPLQLQQSRPVVFLLPRGMASTVRCGRLGGENNSWAIGTCMQLLQFCL